MEHWNSAPYDTAKFPVAMQGNLFLKGAMPAKAEAAPRVNASFDPAIKLLEKPDGWYLSLNSDPASSAAPARQLVTSELLGKAKVSACAYENPDASPLRIDADYFGKPRNATNPAVGPIEAPVIGSMKVW